MEDGLVRELVAEPRQPLVDVLRLGADVVAAVVVDVLGREPIVEDVVVVALVQDQDAVVLQHRVELGEGLPAVLLREQMGQRVSQADDRVVLGVDVPAEPAPVGMEGLHDETLPLGVLEGLCQHLGAAVHAGDVEPGLEQPNGMEARSGGHVQDTFHAPFLEDVDEEVAFAGGPRLPVDEFVPFPHEAVDVLTLVLVGLALGDGVVSVQLLVTSCFTSSVIGPDISCLLPQAEKLGAVAIVRAIGGRPQPGPSLPTLTAQSQTGLRQVTGSGKGTILGLVHSRATSLNFQVKLSRR